MGNCQDVPQDSYLPFQVSNNEDARFANGELNPGNHMQEASQSRRLVVKGRISNQDSQGIFDYENENNANNPYPIKEFRMSKNVRLTMDSRKVMSMKRDGKRDFLEDELAIFRLRGENLHIIPNQMNVDAGGFWFRVYGEESVNIWAYPQYQLKQNDYIQLGRIVLKIKQMSPGCRNDQTFLKSIGVCKKEYKQPTIVTKPLENSDSSGCIICYASDASEEEPLINMCNCKGSVSYYHFSCVKTWLQYQVVEKKTNFFSQVSIANLKCMMCHVNFPRIPNPNVQVKS